MGIMRSVALIAAFSVACVALTAADDNMVTIIRPVAIALDSQGEAVVIAQLSRAPFPQPRAIPAERLAMMRVLANCREEAFAYCGVYPERPVCPMRVAHCLTDQPTERLSMYCAASVHALRPHMEAMHHMAHINHLERGSPQEDANSLQQVAAASTSEYPEPEQQEHSMNHLYCMLHRGMHYFMARVPGFIMCFIVGVLLALFCHAVLRCTSEDDQEDEEEASNDAELGSKVVMSEPYVPPPVLLAAPSMATPPVTTAVVVQGSEDQV